MDNKLVSNRSRRADYEVLNKIYYHTLRNFFRDIQDMNYAIIKGEALSLVAYGGTGYRLCTDVDLLILKKDLYRFDSLLKKYGFKQYSENGNREARRSDRLFSVLNSHQDLPYILKIPSLKINIAVDLNFDLFWGGYEGNKIDIEQFLKDSKKEIIHGNEVKILTVEKSIIQVCLHHYKDMNSLYILATKGYISANQLEDIFNLVNRYGESFTADRLYEVCVKYKVVKYVYYVLYHTAKLYSSIYFDNIIDFFASRNQNLENTFNTYGLRKEEYKSWWIPFEERISNDNVSQYITSQLTDSEVKGIKKNNLYFNSI